MRVCHFVASEGLGRGDVFVDLANAQSERADVWIVAPEGARFAANLDYRVRLVTYPGSGSRYNPMVFLRLLGIFRKIKPAIVHTHFAKATQIFETLNVWLRLPKVATKHNPRKGRIFNRVEPVIAVSQGVADSISHDRVRVIHNGIAIVPIEKRTQKNLRFTILAVGRLEKVKAFDRLIEECADLQFDFELQIAGDGPEKAALAQLAEAKGVADKVLMLGHRNDIPSLMQQADAVVVCSHSEGFCLVLLEALNYANVLISRRVGIAPELLPESLLISDFEVAERLAAIYADQAGYEQIFAAVKEAIGSDYSIERAAREHLDYYRDICQG